MKMSEIEFEVLKNIANGSPDRNNPYVKMMVPIIHVRDLIDEILELRRILHNATTRATYDSQAEASA
jgi:hypothetical protein